MQSTSKNNRKSVIIATAVIVVIAIIGSVGYMYWNNSQKQKVPSIQQTALERKASQEKKEEEKSQSTSKDLQEGYLVLKDWGVKLKMPDGMGEVVYYKKSFKNSVGSNKGETVEGYEFTTKRLEALGGKCVDSPAGGDAVRLGTISRGKTKQEPTVIGPVYLNDGLPINGYYYFVGYAQAACTMKDLDIQGQDRKLVIDLLQSITAV